MNEPSIAGVRFIVTSACNYNCGYCHNEWEPKGKPVAGTEKGLIDSIITSAKELNASEVDLTGGEPLLELGRVQAILESARDNGLWTNMTTNGLYLDENLESLRDWGLREVHVHVPSLIEERYNATMRGNANLPKVLGGIERAVSVLDKVMVNVPVERDVNDSEIPEFITYFNRMGATPRFIESMSTKRYIPLNQETIEAMVEDQLGSVEKTGEYLWGISTYTVGEDSFETLRCICFDRKCDVCPTTNFIHVDKDYKVRPCNLRPTRFDIGTEDSKEVLVDAVSFLREQKDVPEQYAKLWGGQLL